MADKPRTGRWLVLGLAILGLAASGVWITSAVRQARSAARRTADL
jgi:hypothetical protein